MKKLFSIVAALLVVFGLAACTVTSTEKASNDGTTANNNATNIGAITVWCAEAAVELTKTQLDAYLAKNTDVKFTYTVSAVGEGDAATQMISDVEAGADIFCFAQDQLSRLVEAGALAKPGDTVKQMLVEANDSASIKAGTVGEELFAYPLTSDNGYFMYYDKSVVAEEHLDDLAAIIADVEAASRTINFELTSGWYNASFFFAVGCSSKWATNEKGAYVYATDNYNSDNGLIALKGMQQLAQSTAYVSGSQASAFNAADGVKAAVVVSGTWDANAAATALGENLGVTDLPSFTVDGKTYHLGSFSGNKLMGVKPQTNGTRALVLSSIAQYLTGEECQAQRFEALGWGPSNKTAQASDAVKENAALSALALQSAYAQPQGQYPNAWWDISKVLGTVAQNAESDADLREGLKTYEDAVKEIIDLQSQEDKDYVLVGEWNGWNNKGEDEAGNATEYKLVKQEDGTYSTIAFLGEGQFGRITEYGDWTSETGYAQMDSDLVEDYGNDNNFTVVAAGVYQISLNPATNAITISQPTFVLVGAWNSWNNADEAYTLVASEDGKTYSFELTAEADQNGRIVFSGTWTQEFGYLLVDAENALVSDDNGGDHNFKFAAAGTYTVTLDPIAKVITIAEKSE